MNYHIGRLVLSSLCVGDLARQVLGGVRFAGFSLQTEHHPKRTAPNPQVSVYYLNPTSSKFGMC